MDIQETAPDPALNQRLRNAYNRGYNAGLSRQERDCPYLSTAAVQAWRDGFQAGLESAGGVEQ